MDLKLIRKWKTEKSIVGELLINSDHFSWTLELPWRDNQHLISCIPLGKYEVTLEPSEKFGGMITPHIKNVPGRDNILIHNGNYPKDTEGCVLVGSTKSVDFVGDSKTTLGILKVKLALAVANKEQITIEIVEA